MTGWLNTVCTVLGLLPCVSSFHLVGPQIPFGMIGNGYSTTSTKASKTCGNTLCYNGYCDKLSFPPKCICTLGFLGEMCHQEKILTYFGMPLPCPIPCGNGECVTNTLTHQMECSCFSGYTGSQCDKQEAFGTIGNGYSTTSTKASKTCGDTLCYNGVCDKLSFPHKCICTLGYLGDMCHQEKLLSFFGITLHCLKPCANGECVTNTLTKQTECSCFSGYTGSQCDKQEALTSKVTTTKQSARFSPSMTTTSTPTTTTKLKSTTTSTITTTPSTTTIPTTTTPVTTTTKPATTTTATTTNPLTTTTKSTTMTSTAAAMTPAPIRFHTCNKLSTVMDLGNSLPVSNTHVRSCPSGSFATPEAFVVEHCSVAPPSNWTQGVNIMKQCDSIPLYTPVATFFNARYSPFGGLSGIFLGCLPYGFKLGVQQCDRLPAFIHLENDDLFTMDPKQYYTVQ